MFLPGQIMGRIFDLGYLKLPFLIGTILLIVATFLVAECHTYWEFLLCQGLAVGVRSLYVIAFCLQDFSMHSTGGMWNVFWANDEHHRSLVQEKAWHCVGLLSHWIVFRWNNFSNSCS